MIVNIPEDYDKYGYTKVKTENVRLFKLNNTGLFLIQKLVKSKWQNVEAIAYTDETEALIAFGKYLESTLNKG